MASEEEAMAYSRGAVERAMKVQEVILRAIDGKLTWVQAADMLGYSPRTIRRIRWRLQHYGYDGLLDRRRQTPSPKRAPVAEVQRLLALYRERYLGFNVRHFHQLARREHGVRFCYAFVKKALQTAGLVAKHQPRGRHRRRREPRACFGELLHLDGSRHRWLALLPEQWFTLIAVVDDATKRLLYAHLREGGESVAAILTALRAVLEHDGVPMALYPDRAHWAVHTPDVWERAGSPAPDPGRPRAGPAGHRTHPRLFAPGARPQRARQPHPARPPRQRTACRRHHHGGRGQSLCARPLPARLQRRVRPAAGRSRLRLCAAGPRRSRPDPLRRGRTHRRARQRRDRGPRAAAARQPTRPPHVRRAAGPGPPPSQRPALRLVWRPLPRSL